MTDILTIKDVEEAKKYIGYPCLLADEYFAIRNLDMENVTVSILRKVEELEMPFYNSEYGYRYCLPIDKECIDAVSELAERFNIQQIYAATKYKVEVTNV